MPVAAPVIPAAARPIAPGAPEPAAKKPAAHKAQDCPICFEPAEPSVHLGCGHDVHQPCLADIVKVALKEKKTNGIVCPVPGCKKVLTQKEVAATDPKQMDTYNAAALKQATDQIAMIPGMKMCKSPNCGWIFENADNIVEPIRCEGACKRQICTSCCEPAHRGLTCKEATPEGKREKASEEYERMNTKGCPNCKARIEKDMGCNHMVCGKCKYQFCWTCLRRDDNYGHQCDYIDRKN